MKRSMGGGAHRGPVAPTRQRRTIRFVQILLVLISGGLMMLAGHSWGRDGAVQVIVLMILGGVAIGGALMLQSPDGTVVLPTPRRLEELATRAEATAIERAQEAAAESGEPAGSTRQT